MNKAAEKHETDNRKSRELLARNGIDLHLHLDGSLPVETAKELARLENIELPDDEKLARALKVPENCRDLNEYLTRFELPLMLLQSEKALELAAYDLAEELFAQGLCYAEIRFAPQLHLQKGLTQKSAAKAVMRGLGASKLQANAILCCMRGKNNLTENLETVRVAEQLSTGEGAGDICALDIAGAEGLFPTELFGSLFAYMRASDIPFTLHAGEAAGPESVWKALEAGASRIGHGVRSIEDPLLVKYLAATGVPLELCPTSNLQTRVFERIEDFPLRKFMDAGLCVTVNTDNLTVSDTSLANEFSLLKRTFSLNGAELDRLRANAAKAAFRRPLSYPLPS